MLELTFFISECPRLGGLDPSGWVLGPPSWDMLEYDNQGCLCILTLTGPFFLQNGSSTGTPVYREVSATQPGTSSLVSQLWRPRRPPKVGFLKVGPAHPV